MFANYTNLNFVRCLATQLGENYSKDWLDGVSSTGKFVRNPAVTVSDLGTGVSAIPTGWTNTITPKNAGERYIYPATATYTVVSTENVGGIRCDTNADGKVTITDAVTVVNYILNGGEATAAPALSEPEEAGQVPE